MLSQETCKVLAGEREQHIVDERDRRGCSLNVEQHGTARYTWVEHSAGLSAVTDLDTLAGHLIAQAPDPARLLAKLTLTGQLAASAHAIVAEWRERLEAQLAYLDVDTAGLAVTVSNDDFAVLGDDETMRGIARKLGERAETVGDMTAKDALALLFDLRRRGRSAGR